MPSEAEVSAAAQIRAKMTAARNHATGESLIRSQKWRLKTYPNVFVGKEGVSWAMDIGLAESRPAATQMFEGLVNGGFIEHAAKKQPFRDGYFFYSWVGGSDHSSEHSSVMPGHSPTLVVQHSAPLGHHHSASLSVPPQVTGPHHNPAAIGLTHAMSSPGLLAPANPTSLPGHPGLMRIPSPQDPDGFPRWGTSGGMQDPAVLQDLITRFIRLCGLQHKPLQHSGYVERQMRFKVVPRYTLLLFADILVVCMAPKEGSELRLKHYLYLERVTPVEKTSRTFGILTPQKTFVFIATNIDDRDVWVSKLKNAVMSVRAPSDSPLDAAILQLQSLVEAKLPPEEQANRLQAVVNLLSTTRAKQFANNLREETLSKVEDKEVMQFLESNFMPALPAVELKLTADQPLKTATVMSMDIAMAFVCHLLKPLDKTEKLNMRCRRVLHIHRTRQEGKEDAHVYEPPSRMNAREQIQYNMWNFTMKFVMKKVDQWDFDIFRLDASTHGRPLSALMLHLFSSLDLFTRFNIRAQTFCNWILALEAGYLQNPYHNRTHAADVVQNTYFFLRSSPFMANLQLETPDSGVLCALLAAAMHDFRHPGKTNAFLCATDDEVAITYNHISVLESMHCAEAFRLMRQPDKNFMENFPPKLRAEVRDMIVAMVLSTDMKKHFELIQRLHDDTTEQKSRQLQLEAMLHCADLGNPTKAQPLMLRWTNLVFEEFYAQGDRERELKLPISLMMDRAQPAMEKSQIGFIDVIVKPLYKTFTVLCPDAEICLQNLQANKEYWQVLCGIDPTRNSATVPPPVRVSMPTSGSSTNIPGSVSAGTPVHSVLSTTTTPPPTTTTTTTSTSSVSHPTSASGSAHITASPHTLLPPSSSSSNTGTPTPASNRPSGSKLAFFSSCVRSLSSASLLHSSSSSTTTSTTKT